LDNRLGKGRGEKLLAGLSPELMRRTACAWGSNVEYTGSPPLGGGWVVGGPTPKYQPRGHADPGVKARARRVGPPRPEASEPSQPDRLADLRADMLDDRKGPGNCIRCHGVTDPTATGEERVNLEKASQLRIEWRHAFGQGGRNVRYSHRPHISLLG